MTQTLHTLDGREIALADDDIAVLEARLDGLVMRPGDTGYDEARHRRREHAFRATKQETVTGPR